MYARVAAALLVASALIADTAWADTVATKWSSANRLNIRSCPSTSCGVTGWIAYGGKVTVYEEKDGWSRISKETSSIRDKSTGWVSTQYLTGNQPKAKTKASSGKSATKQPAARLKPGSYRKYYRGKRGGCYYFSASGNRVYVERSLCRR